MKHLAPISVRNSVLSGFGVLFLALVYVLGLRAGMSHLAVLRNLVFWALVLCPVAVVLDFTARAVANYRAVTVMRSKLEPARVKRR